ncbi:hypothetical protein [Corallococcus llansteffanensis]|uniref:Uncharacterized protein n=1 Tax=Corallococcus llansteffanensis TaxID=2316731 RepID=A0A3A8P764_9BACT|nr:hypothetical protein [Corallococcus llansteffanensis]RKH52193.1 hypothetical protein D7V93_28275 [Corallococcus llansteffanensis]
MTLNDSALLERFSRGELSEFPHLDHVRVVYLHTRRAGRDAAVEFARAGLQRLTRQLGVPEKYHETVTVAWARLVGERTEIGPCRDFAEFLDHNPQFQRKELLDDYYSREVLFGPDARARFVEPDLRPLP